MPFSYFGSKHGLAKFYPAPRYSIIVEPFAGAAGYSCYYFASPSVKQVLLWEIDASVVALWDRLKGMSVKDLYDIDDPIKGERTLEPLIAAASGEQGMAVLHGKSRQITDRMVSSWPRLRSKTEASLPHLHKVSVTHGPYTDSPDVEATWFIDPPYTPRASVDVSRAKGGGGLRYEEHNHGQGTISYPDLARWARLRKGQVMVCEQMPATWLPFIPFRNQRNGVGAGTQSTRTEAVWMK